MLRELVRELVDADAEAAAGHQSRQIEVEVERREMIAEPSEIATEIAAELAPVVAEVARDRHVAAAIVLRRRDLQVAALSVADDGRGDAAARRALLHQPRELARAAHVLAVELDDDVAALHSAFVGR